LLCYSLLLLLTTAIPCFDADHSYCHEQYFLVNGSAENYFVAGHSLPLWVVAMTLGAQSIDSNALLGNVDLSYKYQFWDGAGTLKDDSFA
jgi:Na+/pantothenate symporter